MANIWLMLHKLTKLDGFSLMRQTVYHLSEIYCFLSLAVFPQRPNTSSGLLGRRARHINPSDLGKRSIWPCQPFQTANSSDSICTSYSDFFFFLHMYVEFIFRCGQCLFGRPINECRGTVGRVHLNSLRSLYFSAFPFLPNTLLRSATSRAQLSSRFVLCSVTRQQLCSNRYHGDSARVTLCFRQRD